MYIISDWFSTTTITLKLKNETKRSIGKQSITDGLYLSSGFPVSMKSKAIKGLIIG